ncbi:hypothetical protein NM688_g5725 [Phlebia brevispora]|uniref:Uncharacterized protein n=1 Tax=Phlebia brevispora TaxID=194682 RepID=A0ACC1SQV0_9APHY|nr:hypothetical protein NM688_g5725 [Phlebia brevispora]
MSSRAGSVSEEDHPDASLEVVSPENAPSEDQDSLHNFEMELFSGHPPLMLRTSKEQRSAARSHSVELEAPDPPQATPAENVVAVEPNTTTEQVHAGEQESTHLTPLLPAAQSNVIPCSETHTLRVKGSYRRSLIALMLPSPPTLLRLMSSGTLENNNASYHVFTHTDDQYSNPWGQSQSTRDGSRLSEAVTVSVRQGDSSLITPTLQAHVATGAGNDGRQFLHASSPAPATFYYDGVVVPDDSAYRGVAANLWVDQSCSVTAANYIRPTYMDTSENATSFEASLTQHYGSLSSATMSVLPGILRTPVSDAVSGMMDSTYHSHSSARHSEREIYPIPPLSFHGDIKPSRPAALTAFSSEESVSNRPSASRSYAPKACLLISLTQMVRRRLNDRTGRMGIEPAPQRYGEEIDQIMPKSNKPQKVLARFTRHGVPGVLLNNFLNAHGNNATSDLDDADDTTIFGDFNTKARYMLLWRGYHPSGFYQYVRNTKGGYITRRKVVCQVARILQDFIEMNRGYAVSNTHKKWSIADQGLTLENLELVELRQISKATVVPVLRYVNAA